MFVEDDHARVLEQQPGDGDALLLVAGHATSADRRAVEVAVTPDGARLLDQLRVRRHETAGELTAGLTPVELTTLRDLLARLTPPKATTVAR